MNNRLPEHNCGKAGTSIQYQINRVIVAKYARKDLADLKLRERIRRELNKKFPNKYCDYKNNYHTTKCDEVSKELISY